MLSIYFQIYLYEVKEAVKKCVEKLNQKPDTCKIV